MDALQREQKRKMEEVSQDSEDPESEEGADEGDEEAKRRRAERRAERRRAKQLAKAAELRRMEERKAFLDACQALWQSFDLQSLERFRIARRGGEVRRDLTVEARCN